MPKGQLNAKKAKSKGVKKTSLKQKKKPQVANGDAQMGGAPRVHRETAHELFKRHAHERKQAKHEVNELKRQRMKLPKKTAKDGKKALSKKNKRAFRRFKGA